ncbi:MAG: sulfite exporter TauE/SafE family protein [Candidatus Aenigmatarchaeota archaeon]
MDILMLVATFFIGVASLFLGSVAGGGGGLLSLPFLIFMGLPPQIAIGTNRFGTLGHLSTSYKFYKEKKIIFKHALPLAAVGIVGAFLGAQLLLQINEALLSKLVGGLILLMVPTLFLGLGKGRGLERKNVPEKRRLAGYAGYFFVAIYDGFFGAAAGLIAVYTLVLSLGYTFIEANALDKFAFLFALIPSLGLFMLSGIVNYEVGLVLLAGMLVGGYLGAHVAIKKGNKFVKLMFSVVVIASALKLLFFS